MLIPRISFEYIGILGLPIKLAPGGNWLLIVAISRAQLHCQTLSKVEEGQQQKQSQRQAAPNLEMAAQTSQVPPKTEKRLENTQTWQLLDGIRDLDLGHTCPKNCSKS